MKPLKYGSHCIPNLL